MIGGNCRTRCTGRTSPDAAPGIFSLDNSGRGQASAINENGTVNSTSNPVSQTGILVFYATGEGQTRPAGQDGRIITSDIRVPVSLAFQPAFRQM